MLPPYPVFWKGGIAAYWQAEAHVVEAHSQYLESTSKVPGKNSVTRGNGRNGGSKQALLAPVCPSRYLRTQCLHLSGVSLPARSSRRCRARGCLQTIQGGSGKPSKEAVECGRCRRGSPPPAPSCSPACAAAVAAAARLRSPSLLATGLSRWQCHCWEEYRSCRC
jgi:hypothetical protein